MLEVDGLFYHFILILGWKWSSIIYRYWLNQLRYITYEELTQSRSCHFHQLLLEIHYLWGIDTRTLLTNSFYYFLEIHYLWGIDTFISLWRKFFCILRDTLPMRNWHILFTQFRLLAWDTLPMRNWHNNSNNFIYTMFTWDTLPMRNWHKQFLIMASSPISEIHYLWGIDTIP